MPWSRFWERNYFADLMPGLHVAMTNNYVRGAISGLGLVNIWIALTELGEMIARREDVIHPRHES